MKKISYILLLAAAFGILLSGQEHCAGWDARAGYDAAVGYIRKKQPDFALLEFRRVARDFPGSLFAEKSTCAIAEYYYDRGMYGDAIENFIWCAKKGSDLETNIIAKVYLLKIIQEIENPASEEKEMLEGIKKELSSKSAFLVLSEYKKTYYRSPSLNRFKVKHYADNVEVYRNGQLFIKVTQ